MKCVVIPERSFDSAFKQAEFELNRALHEAQDNARRLETPVTHLALSGVQNALSRLKERLLEQEV